MLRDLKIVNDYLKYLREHPDKNFDITGRGKSYLMPFFWEEFVRSSDSPNGLLVYYSEIKEALESAFVHCFIPKEKLPRYAPKDLEVLVI